MLGIEQRRGGRKCRQQHDNPSEGSCRSPEAATSCGNMGSVSESPAFIQTPSVFVTAEYLV